MSFLYPRLVTFVRPGAQTGEGQLGYGAQTQATETTIVAGVPCNIQLRREGQKNGTGLPGDGDRPTYDLRAPKSALAKGVVQDKDIAVDDLGGRYLVVASYWDSLGYALRVERLEA